MRVALMKWTGPETIAQALEAVDAWKEFRIGMNVLVKPNAIMAGSAKLHPRGITTDPRVVEAVVRIVREKGASSVRIGDGSVDLPSLKIDSQAAFKWSGITAIADREGVPILDLNKGPFRTFTMEDGTEIEIAEAVFKADFVINIPILKTHNQTMVTVCLKNLKGCLSTASKKKCHIETDLNRAIAEFNKFIPCHLNVVDALTGTEIGPTPTGRADQVRDMGLILAGKDRLACDVVGSYLLGYPAASVPHLSLFADMAGRSTNLSDIQVIGENPADHQLNLKYTSHWLEDLMEKYSVSGMQMPPYGLRLCSACGFNLWAGLMEFCKSQQGNTIEKTELIAGKEARPTVDTDHTILLGKCAIKTNKALKNAIRVPGCPPDPAKIVEIMTKALVTGK